MIERAKIRDYSAIYDIYCWYVKNSDAIFDLMPKSEKDFCCELYELQKRFPIFVAKHEGEIIGYAYAHPAFSKEAYQFDVELTIYFKDGPHYGLALPLYEVLEDALSKQHIRYIISCITDSNKESIEFHKKLGYSFSGKLEKCGLKNGKWLGVEWYVKAITPANEYLERNLKFVPYGEIV